MRRVGPVSAIIAHLSESARHRALFMRTLAFRFCRFLCWALFNSTCRVTVSGQPARWPAPLVIAANHISHFDPPLLGAMARPIIDFMAMQDLFASRWFGWWFRLVFCIPVDREGSGSAALREGLLRLRAGRTLGIFPEGGLRTGAASVLGDAPLPPGAAALATRTGAAVLPCLILGTDQLYAGRAWLRRPQLRVVFGSLISATTADGHPRRRDDVNREIERAIKMLYAQWCASPDFDPLLVPRSAQERWAANR